MSSQSPTNRSTWNPVVPSLQLQFQIAPSDRPHPSFDRNDCRSASRQLVEILKKTKCAHCGDTFLGKINSIPSEENLPVIAYCGHYVCARHEEEAKRNCELYECPAELCRARFRNIANSEDRKVFVRDKVIEDFYKAITKPGFPCAKCEEWHPKENVVCFKHKKGLSIMCVWCAAKSFTCEVYKLEHINRYITHEGWDYIGSKGCLSSLDRTQNSAGWALNTCCICLKTLYDGDDHGSRFLNIYQLPCHHISHQMCVDNAPPEFPGIGCSVCGAGHGKNGPGFIMRPFYIGYFRELIYCPQKTKLLKKDGVYFRCNKKCNQKHPDSNVEPQKGGMETCVWCILLEREEKREEKRLKKKR